MVVQHETGFLVQPADPIALAKAIEDVIDDRLLAQKLGEAGHQRAQELFSIEKNVRELCALIDASVG
jgi:glycosyltransferase involved in cell wall biosynthesis